ncbi:MAG: FesM [Gemmatimonadota bacterium]
MNTSPQRRDLLLLPGIGRFLQWRHARTSLQVVSLGLATLIILDGLFGPQIAPRNLAGTLPWVHWRGFVVLALLAFGNLFCMACPFMLPRRLSKRFGPADRSWPRALRSKWPALILLLFFFWAYEAFSLWASPWLTAWVALTYFALAFVIDGFFKGASFCKHLCPIGQFHFVNSMVSPAEVRVRDPEVCGACTTLDCIRGRYEAAPISIGDAGGTPRLATDFRPPPRDAASGRAMGREGLIQGGCELALYQPRKVGNGDCTFCLECIHACPHENVGILLRSPLEELARDEVRSGIGRLARKPDWAALATILVFGAFMNALGMVAPVLGLRDRAESLLPFLPPAAILAGLFLLGFVAVPAGLLSLTAWASSRLASGGSQRLFERVSTYVWSLVPVGFAMWTAHYLFHFLVGGLTIVPVVQEYLGNLGLPHLGDPRWGAGALVPESWLLPIEGLILQIGLLFSLVVGFRIARREEGNRKRALTAFLPWGILATLLTFTGFWLLGQPMEMRGTFR